MSTLVIQKSIMLLVIHNLPTKIGYSEVKELIRNRCNLKDLIVDNLVYESPQSRKVTIGLSYESDAISVTKQLDGLLLMGHKLQVEDLRKNQGPNTQKSSSNQGNSRANMSQGDKSGQDPIPPYVPPVLYSAPYYMAGQNQNAGSSQGSNSQGQPPVPVKSSVPQYMQDNPYNAPYFMYGQGYPTYRMATPQSPYMVPSPYGSPSIPMIQNTDFVYGVTPNHGNNQPMTVTSEQPDYIPCGSDKPRNEYAKKDTGSRYFEKKNDQKYRDRSERPSTSRGDRETYAPRSRPDERRHDDCNPERFRRSDNRNSDKIPKHTRDSYHQSYDRNYKSEPERSGLKRTCDDRRNAGSSENFGDETNRRYDNKQDDNCDLPSDRAAEKTYETSRFMWTKPKHGNEYRNSNFGGYKDSKPGTSNQGNFNTNEMHSHNRLSNLEDPSFAELNEPAIFLTKTEFKKIKKARDRNRSALENKDDTLRSQAVSKIVRTAVEESGLKNIAKKPGFLPFMKSIVRTRINRMLGYRMAVPMDNIIEQYYKIFPAHIHKNFVLESKAKFNKITDFPSGATPIRTPLMKQTEATNRPTGTNRSTATNQPAAANQPTAQRRKATEQPPSVPKPKKPAVEIPRPPPYRPPSPGPLPKYPNADKKAYKKLKTLAKEEHQKEIYTLEPNLKEALDKEIKVLDELFRQGCRDHNGGEDEKICQRIEKTTDEIMKVIKLDITKRLLNVTCNLPLRMFANGRYKVKELGPLLKPYGIISCRKTNKRAKLGLVVCQDYPSYDYLCTKGDIDVGNGLILTFKPLHLAGPRKRPTKAGKVYQTSDEDEEFGDETGDADVEEIGDEMSGDDGTSDIEGKENLLKEIVANKEEKTDGDIKEEKEYKFIVNQHNDLIDVKPKAEPIEKPSDSGTENQENSETKNFVKDIKELAQSIVNDSKVENLEAFDISNIAQDDLEDY